MHKRFVFYIVSRIILITSLFMILPLLWALHDHPASSETYAFIASIVLGLIIASLGFWHLHMDEEDYSKMNPKDGLAAVGLAWICMSLLGSLPFFLSGVVASFTDAVFEVVSGFTTTGASVIVDIESMPRGILFWRSLTHWMGGMGIIVLYVAFLPAFGQNSVQMFQAEASGLTIEKVAPRLRENAKNLWLIYLLFSLSGVIAFFAGGMSLFDSFCHTFGAIATGGFSTKNTNMMAFGAYHQWVAIVLMFMGGINFIVHYRAFTGKPLYYFKDEEFHWYSSIIILFTLFFSLFLFKEKLSVSPIRDSLFQVVSILTTTGYNSVDFDLWPNALRFGLLILIFIGGCAGSTSGGLKVVRFLIGVKAVYQTVIQAMFPNAIVKTRLNTISLPDKVIVAIGAYFVLTVIMIFFGVQLLTLFDGCDIVTGLSATMASISAVGPGLNQVGPVLNYGWFSNPSKWVLIFLMLAGRLEFYSFLILFVPAIWKK